MSQNSFFFPMSNWPYTEIPDNQVTKKREGIDRASLKKVTQLVGSSVSTNIFKSLNDISTIFLSLYLFKTSLASKSVLVTSTDLPSNFSISFIAVSSLSTENVL